jgi:preprotein translocase subunit SecF
MIPQMVFPMAVFAIVKYFFNIEIAVAAIGLLGLIGFLLKDKIFDLIVKRYKTEKYSTLEAFKKAE